MRFRRILVASVGCGVLRFVAIGWAAGELWIVLMAQLLHAATFGSFHAAAVAAVHRVFPEQAQARGQTLFSSVSYGAGAAAGLLLAGWAWEARRRRAGLFGIRRRGAGRRLYCSTG